MRVSAVEADARVPRDAAACRGRLIHEPLPLLQPLLVLPVAVWICFLAAQLAQLYCRTLQLLLA